MNNRLFRWAIAALLQLAAAISLAQPVSIDVPYAAGGPSDALARSLAGIMSRTLGEPVNINNVLGNGGLTGLRQFVRRDPSSTDVILVGSPTFLAAAINEPALLDQLRPLGLVGLKPMAIVGARSPSFEESVAKPARAAGSLTMGISAAGSASHLCAAQLAEALGIPLKVIAYKGMGPLLTDLIGGHIGHACIDLPAADTFVKDGRLKVAAATGEEAVARLGNAPTLESLKVTGVTRGEWYVVMVREAAPSPFVDRLSEALRAALAADPVNAQLRNLGFIPVPAQAATATAATAFIQREYGRIKPFLPVFKQ